MRHATQVELGKRIFAHIDAGTTDMSPEVARNPVSAFTCEKRLAREWETLFLGRPQYVGLSCLIPEPGDYLTNDDLGVPILATRDRTGRVRAFLNVCRHRGARVAEGCGKGKRVFVCPYHAWSYDTSGRLVALPERKSFGEVDRSAFGLRELPAGERHGMVWVAPRPDGKLDLDAVFEGLDDDLAGFDLAGQHHYGTRTMTRRMNWKIVMDTFLESYHFPALHTETVGPLFIPNLSIVDTYGPNLREVFVRRTIEEMRAEPEEDWDLVRESALVYAMPPNTVVVVLIDHYEIWRFYPVDGKVDETKVYLEFYTPEPPATEEADAHWQRNLDLTVRTVELEDFTAGEGIQSGAASGAQEHVVYGRNEAALQHFEKTVAALVGERVGALPAARAAA